MRVCGRRLYTHPTVCPGMARRNASRAKFTQQGILAPAARRWRGPAHARVVFQFQQAGVEADHALLAAVAGAAHGDGHLVAVNNDGDLLHVLKQAKLPTGAAGGSGRLIVVNVGRSLFGPVRYAHVLGVEPAQRPNKRARASANNRRLKGEAQIAEASQRLQTATKQVRRPGGSFFPLLYIFFF